jgi:Holliday junction DNA helicase RuvA
MIAKLTGRIEAIEADRCVVDVNGVGYLVQASTRTLAALPAGGIATLLVEMQVREDAISLF